RQRASADRALRGGAAPRARGRSRARGLARDQKGLGPPLRTIQVPLRAWGPRAGILHAAGRPAVSSAAAGAEGSRRSYCEITGTVRRDGATDGTGSDATARIHHASRRRGGAFASLAARGARAAAGDASGRLPQ